MKSFVRKASLAGACLILVGVANAQAPIPPDSAQTPSQTPTLGYTPSASADDLSTLREALRSAQQGDVSRADSLRGSLSDPIARKLVLWALADRAGESMPFSEIDQARRDLWGWPRAARREAAAEKQLQTQSLSPQAMVAWFNGEQPQTPEGAIALAGADQALGKTDDAKILIRHFWRCCRLTSRPWRARAWPSARATWAAGCRWSRACPPACRTIPASPSSGPS